MPPIPLPVTFTPGYLGLQEKNRPGVRVIAAAHGASVNTVQRIAHGQ